MSKIHALAIFSLFYGACAIPHIAFGAEYYQGGAGVELPDPQATPGKANVRVTQANIAVTICKPGYTATVRHVSEGAKRAVFGAYGVDLRARHLFEVDHLISLELGGANDAANLWPQKYEQASSDPPGAHAKDKLENHLHRQVCSGAMPLAEAQQRIAVNWYIAYQRMVAGR